ncbi:uncharacterized protein [Canis lupus baileyi]|uniref:uncharacterized protein n=1 Tax=Canis lupus baileyi TaxID=143281 RepID=UPI003B97107C
MAGSVPPEVPVAAALGRPGDPLGGAEPEPPTEDAPEVFSVVRGRARGRGLGAGALLVPPPPPHPRARPLPPPARFPGQQVAATREAQGAHGVCSSPGGSRSPGPRICSPEPASLGPPPPPPPPRGRLCRAALCGLAGAFSPDGRAAACAVPSTRAAQGGAVYTGCARCCRLHGLHRVVPSTRAVRGAAVYTLQAASDPSSRAAGRGWADALEAGAAGQHLGDRAGRGGGDEAAPALLLRLLRPWAPAESAVRPEAFPQAGAGPGVADPVSEPPRVPPPPGRRGFPRPFSEADTALASRGTSRLFSETAPSGSLGTRGGVGGTRPKGASGPRPWPALAQPSKPLRSRPPPPPLPPLSRPSILSPINRSASA